jgi:hypothetical protein
MVFSLQGKLFEKSFPCTLSKTLIKYRDNFLFEVLGERGTLEGIFWKRFPQTPFKTFGNL